MDKMLGVMLDCSRNAVMNVDAVKEFANILKEMGYNTLMLYTEDTYELNNNPLFGYMRGRYTKEEIKDLDAYCNSIGIELIPCIQTLAHLNCIFKWTEYADINDCDDILLMGEEKTYKLIDSMFETLSECFTSRKIHIGMDEADRVSTGKYQEKHGICDKFEAINEHLHKVCEIADKYGFETMVWSDMFVKFAFGSNDYYAIKDTSEIQNKAKLPDNVSLVYWDYFASEYDSYIERVKVNKTFGKKVYFAGGAWTWKSFAPDNTFSIDATKTAIDACNETDIDGTFITVWGDDGAECLPHTVLPTLMCVAEFSKGNFDMGSIKAKFKEIVGCNFDDFMLLDTFDMPGGKHKYSPGKYEGNASKYLFYNDLFMGLNDYRCSESDEKFYRDLCVKIKNIKDRGNYYLLFDAYEKLADVLSMKSYLGVKTRKAYKEKNIKELKKLIMEFKTLIKKLEVFYASYQKMWCSVNKPHGFDILDIRIGGVIRRVKSCITRLSAYIKGEITEIPELNEKIIEAEPDLRWSRLISANVVAHYL